MADRSRFPHGTHEFPRRREPSPVGTILCGALLFAATTACSGPAQQDPTHLTSQYFAADNAAARQGPGAQQQFLARTQHPDFAGRTCPLGDVTVESWPALSTLRPDPKFRPDGENPPRGQVWVVGVEVTVRRNGTIIARQIGSQHVVMLDGRMYGFAPCPS